MGNIFKKTYEIIYDMFYGIFIAMEGTDRSQRGYTILKKLKSGYAISALDRVKLELKLCRNKDNHYIYEYLNSGKAISVSQLEMAIYNDYCYIGGCF